jgi:hypothetical protein
MGHAILIETPFASATQTAKILGVSKVRQRQLAKMLKLSRLGSQSTDKKGSAKSDAPKKKRLSSGRNSSN